MEAALQTDSEQVKLWNGTAGRAWVDAQELLDGVFKPFEDMLADAVAAQSARRVLDVGCGTGATTLAAARRLPPGGRCVGADISGPMIELARTRASQEGAAATFLLADAGAYPFEPAAFDMIISRFGVMFFDDPAAAFANLRRAAADGAALRAIAWRSADENPFMTTAERAAAPFLPDLPPRRPDAPGQFAFADERRVRSILETGGWRDVDLRPVDVVCAFPEDGLTTYLTRLGPVGMVLQDADGETRRTVVETVRAAFEPYIHGPEVRFTAACWMIGARA